MWVIHKKEIQNPKKRLKTQKKITLTMVGEAWLKRLAQKIGKRSIKTPAIAPPLILMFLLLL